MGRATCGQLAAVTESQDFLRSSEAQWEGEDEGVDEGADAAGEQGEARRRGAPLAGTANSSPVETPSGSPATSCGRV